MDTGCDFFATTVTTSSSCAAAIIIIIIIKPNGYTDFSNLFWNKNLHVSHSSSVHHHEFFTEHTAIHTGLLRAVTCQQTCMTYTIAVCMYSEKLLIMDRGTLRNMYSFIPKLNLRN